MGLQAFLKGGRGREKGEVGRGKGEEGRGKGRRGPLFATNRPYLKTMVVIQPALSFKRYLI